MSRESGIRESVRRIELDFAPDDYRRQDSDSEAENPDPTMTSVEERGRSSRDLQFGLGEHDGERAVDAESESATDDRSAWDYYFQTWDNLADKVADGRTSFPTNTTWHEGREAGRQIRRTTDWLSDNYSDSTAPVYDFSQSRERPTSRLPYILPVLAMLVLVALGALTFFG